jgi:uncharacterized spore protein YtfJ
MEHVNTLIDIVTGTVSDVAKSDVVVGEPIVLGDTTLIPLSRVSVGFGAGGGEGEGKGPAGGRRRRGRGKASNGNGNGGGECDELAEGKGLGMGAGGGGKVRPVGVIVMAPDGVRVEMIRDRTGVLDKLVDRVPELIDLIKDAVAKS